MEMQAMIYTAVHFTSIPSKPIRNLPTMGQIKKYRSGVFAMRWKIANQYNMKKLEMKRRKEEAFLMQYEEILSKAYERSLLLREEKVVLKQRAEQMLLQRELLEAERRNGNMSHQFLQDLQNRKQIDIRKQQEILWRIEEANRKDREAHELVLRTLQKRELELMKHEDLESKLFRQDYVQYQISTQDRENEFQSILQQLYQNFQQKRVLNMKLYNTAYMPTVVVIQPGYHTKQQYQNKSYDQLKLGERTRIRHNMPYSMTYGYMFNQLKLQLSIWIESWKFFLSTLPLKSKYALQAEESFRSQFINNDSTVDRLLNHILQNSCFSYQQVYKHLHLWSLTSTKLYAMSLTKSNNSTKETAANSMIQLASQLVNYLDLFTFGEGLLCIDNESDQISVGSSFSQTQIYNPFKEICQPETVFESLDMKTMNVVLRDYMELNIKLNEKVILSRPNSNTLRRNSSYTSSPSTPIRPFSGKKNSGPSASNSPQLLSPTTPLSTGNISGKYSFRPGSTGKSSKSPKKPEQKKRPKAVIAPTFIRPPSIPSIPFSSAPQFSLPLSYRLIYPVERLTKLYYLIQYSYLVRMREEKYQILFQSKALFQTVHDQLFKLRQSIKSSKLLRFERQQQLQKATEYENILIKVRKAMVSSGLWLYESLFYEIKLFLVLFYSKRDLIDMPWLEPDPNLEKSESSFGSRKDRFRRNIPGSSSRLTSSNRSSSNLNRSNSRKNIIDGKSFGKIKVTQPKQTFTYSLKSMKKSHLARSKTFKKVIKAKNGTNRFSKTQTKSKYFSKQPSKKNRSLTKSLSVNIQNTDDEEDGNTSMNGDDNSSLGSKSFSSIGSNKSSGGGIRNTAMSANSNINENLQLSPNRSRKKFDQEFISNQIAILPVDSVSTDNASLLTSSLYSGNSSSGRYTPSTSHRNTTARTATKTDIQSPSIKVQSFANINDKFRSFNLTEDDHESYWYDLHLETFHTITPLDMLKLGVPPFPTYEHDGQPHIVKPKMKTSNRKFVYDSDSSEQSENSGSPHKSRQSQYSRGRMKDGQHNSHRNKTTFNSRLSNFSNNLKNSRKKERKFFDIPGENLFLESNIHCYDFYIWCEALVEWIQNILHWKFPLESQWKEQQIADCFACLQRIEYLSSFTIDIEDATIQEVIQRHGVATNSTDQNNKKTPYSILTKSEEIMKRIPKNSVMSNSADVEKTVAAMKLLQDAKIQEMYEILLYKSDIYVTTRHQGKEYKLTLDADTLDELIGRHPISLFIREMMLQDVQYFQSSKIIPSLSYSKNITMIDLTEQHQNSLILSVTSHSTADGFVSSKKLELFNVLSKEVFELEQAIQVLISQRLLTFHVYHPQKSVVNTGLYFTPSVLPSNWYEYKRVVSNECMKSIQTDEHWLFQFPAYMQPVLHFGTTAPPETFIRRLLREQKEGSHGKYSRIHRLDKRIDIIVKKFVKELKKRQAVTKFLMEYFEKQRKYEIDRTLMMLEDKLGIVHRYRRNMQLLEMAQSTCCFRLCGICCLPKYAKIHLETSSFQERQYYRAIEKMKLVEKQLRYLRSYPIHFNNSMFSKVWKSIVTNNYKKTEEFTFLCQQFRIEMVELADFKKLSTSLDAIDKLMERKQYFRAHSWITGEAVSFNSDGNILDPKVLIVPKLAEMSSIYSQFISINFDNKNDEALVTMPSCQESFIAGGLKSAMCMLRLVESNDVNARGRVLFEPFSAETIANALKIAGRDYFSDIYMKFVPKIFPTSSSNQLQLFWSNLNQKVIRTGCAMYPVCENLPTHLAEVITFRQHYLQNKSLGYFTHERAKNQLLQPAQLLSVIHGIAIKARYQLEEVELKRLIILQANIRGFLRRLKKTTF